MRPALDSGVAHERPALGRCLHQPPPSPLLWPWVAVYLALLGTAAVAGFRRRDL